MLVFFRLGGLMVFAPVVGSPIIPVQVRVMIAAMLAAVLYPTLDAKAPSLDLLTLGPLVAAEVAIGLTIGLLAALPMYAVQLGGQVMGQQIGMGLAGIYNPALDTESDVIGQMLLYVAIAVFVGFGGLEIMFLAVAETFARVPPGEAMGAVSGAGIAELLMNVVASGFEIALRVSAPVLCIIMIEMIAMGFLTKTLPQVNLMSIGFASKVVLALLVLVWGMGAIGEAIGGDVVETLDVMMQWARGIGT